MSKTQYRSIFISDLHLGARAASAEVMLEFLKNANAEYLYLVGDIIDGWALKRKFYFPQSHVNVLRKILAWSNRGVKVTWLAGNHDEALRGFLPLCLGNIEIMDETVHETLDGRKLLVIHGDQFDQVMQYAKWLAWLGDHGYNFLVGMNRYINWIRRHLGFGYWSLSAYAKRKVKTAASFIGQFEQAVIHGVEQRGFDGVVCGHIHFAEIKVFDRITYYNDGDGCESCTALVEHLDGRFELLHFPPV